MAAQIAQIKVAQTVAKAKDALTIQGLRKSFRLDKEEAQPPAPVLPSPQQNLRRTARTLWVLAFSFLWTGLVTFGWEKTEYSGIKTVDDKTFHQTLIGTYGLWNVVYQLTSEKITVSYSMWNAPQNDRLPLILIQLTQTFMLVATVSGLAVFLTHLRGWCSRKEEVQERFCMLSAYAAIPQFLCTTFAIVTWRCIQPTAFTVFCTQDGCVREPQDNISSISVSYTWVFTLISAIISLFLALTLWRLAHWSDEDEEVEIQLSQGQHRAPPPEPKGPKTIGPITPIGYLAIAKMGDNNSAATRAAQAKLNNTPSWLVGV